MDFPPIVILGLEKDYRGADLESELKEAGLAYEKFAGVDARALGGEKLAELADQDASEVTLLRSMSPGEIGCALSHRQIQRAAASGEGDWTVVLEDDAAVTERFLALPEVLDQLPSGRPAVVCLLTQPNYTVLSGRTLRSLDTVIGRQDIARTWFPPVGAHGYAINRAAAVLVARTADRVGYVADWPPAWAYDVGFFVTIPPMVVLRSGQPSTLQPDRGPRELRARSNRRDDIARHLASLVGLRYLRHRGAYPHVRAYYRHEVVRPLLGTAARRLGRRVAPRRDAPWVL